MKSNEHLVIITGHSSGLGRALLELCLQDGACVVGIARRRVELQHPHLKQIQADFSRADETIDQLLHPLSPFLAATDWKTVTLVNNAGTMQPVGFMGGLDANAIAASIHTNLTMPLQLSNWLLHRFPGKRLHLAQISSGASHKPYAGWSVYCSSKAALRMASQVMAAETEGSACDLRIVVYEPGVMDTPMQDALRRMGADVFPQVERFRQLRNSRQLVSPHDSALELWHILCRKDLPRYLEKRYGIEGV